VGFVAQPRRRMRRASFREGIGRGV